jgi:hypothetical protein
MYARCLYLRRFCAGSHTVYIPEKPVACIGFVVLGREIAACVCLGCCTGVQLCNGTAKVIRRQIQARAIDSKNAYYKLPQTNTEERITMLLEWQSVGKQKRMQQRPGPPTLASLYLATPGHVPEVLTLLLEL